MIIVFCSDPGGYILIFARTVPTSPYNGFAISAMIYSILAVMSLKKDPKLRTLNKGNVWL